MSKHKGGTPLCGRADVSGLGGRGIDPYRRWDWRILVIRSIVLVISHDRDRGKRMVWKMLRVAVGANDETMVNRAGLTHWSRQEGLISSSRGSLAGSPVVDLLHKETSRDS
ncbi:hypothetical protein HanXRQr2_Chr15g0677531 [Helianthus annuus]|uniref:Uncharacterized protein n=1 Tax=Helianthus annuus TaxID=4232 RepID=A0A9K3DYX5_HELAN|nr:hypothetical protein HanXRQr2_Chr15g0677531 [Helianthus annuus]